MKKKNKENEPVVKDPEAEYTVQKKSNPIQPKTEIEKNTFSIHEAKTNLSKLVKRAAAGETIYIGSFGKPEVMITMADQRKINAQLRAGALGCMKHIKLPEGWEDPVPEEIIDIMMYSMQGLEDWDKK
ncbi:MAG: hypothetical protein FWB86_05445 [Treponema sp.]|nr:hypothetical protein [Treponema sp.]MCL2250550.1 hypothetical protein [Treponema sp.]